jgi:hypothetical protein
MTVRPERTRRVLIVVGGCFALAWLLIIASLLIRGWPFGAALLAATGLIAASCAVYVALMAGVFWVMREER